MDIIGLVFLFFGLGFFVIGVVGIMRFPDAFSRLHASGKVATVGVIGILIGASFLLAGAALKALALGAFLLLAGPVASHAIATSARSEYAVKE